MLSTTGDTTRHVMTIWRGDKAWHWKAIYIGHAQPLGHRNVWIDRNRWRIHFTPICVSRDRPKWTVGLCLGKRTVYLYSHR